MVIVINKWAYIRGRGAYIWYEVSVSTCGGLIHKGFFFVLFLGGGGLIFVGLRYNVLKCNENAMCINMQHL